MVLASCLAFPSLVLTATTLPNIAFPPVGNCLVRKRLCFDDFEGQLPKNGARRKLGSLVKKQAGLAWDMHLDDCARRLKKRLPCCNDFISSSTPAAPNPLNDPSSILLV